MYTGSLERHIYILRKNCWLWILKFLKNIEWDKHYEWEQMGDQKVLFDIPGQISEEDWRVQQSNYCEKDNKD